MPRSAIPLRRLGLIVNPVAGLGGRVGLKGTDGGETQRRAYALGARPMAALRAGLALDRLERAPLALVAAPRAMGEDVARAHGFEPAVIGDARDETDGGDTRAAARAMMEAGVDLLLFCGGDGTARDVLDGVGANLPVLGVPAGVKMRSGVFAATPASAADAALEFLRDDQAATLRDGEVIDVDERALREDRFDETLYGHLRVPVVRDVVLRAKRSAAAGEEALDALCAEVAGEHREGLVLFGPGTTTRQVLAHLGIEGSLLGVDAVRDGALVARDASEAELLGLIGDGPVRIVMGIVGGQGVLFGRGNQQLSPAVLRRAGADAITIIAGLDKLTALEAPHLHVDTGDPAVDRMLSGYRRVRYAPSMSSLLRISS
jgi:predicted polyphosphate/ATP-dependent NAD kinase